MARVYIKQIIEELVNLKTIDYYPLYQLIDRKSLKNNKLIRFNNNKKTSDYYCTFCGHTHTGKNVNLHTKLKCPNCGHNFYVLGKHNNIEDVEDYITRYEVNKRKELIARLFYFKKEYDKVEMKYKTQLFEVVRLNVDRDIAVKKDTYWVMCTGWRHAEGYRDWKRDNDRFSYYRDNAFHDCFLYDIVQRTNLKNILSKTKYKYSAMDIVARNGSIDTIGFLRLWEMYPKVELLAKAKCFNLIKDLIYRGNKYSVNGVMKLIEDNKKSLHLIADMDLTVSEFKMAVKYQLKDKKTIKMAVKCDMFLDVKTNQAAKIIQYLGKQNCKCHEYRDYLETAALIGMDLKNSNVRFPKNIHKAHNDVMNKYKVVKDELINKKISDFSKDLEKYIYEDKKLIIKPAQSQQELIDESKQLDHCVRNYGEKMAKRETSIFFIRKKKNLKKSYVTLELKEGRVVQVRGYKNNVHNPLDQQVIDFVHKWEQEFRLEGF